MSLKNGMHSRFCAACAASPAHRLANSDRPTDKFPASAFFETMNSALNSSEADKKQAMDMGKGIYAFTLKNAAGETDSWHIDLKNEGKVNKGLGEKPDGALSRKNRC